MNEELVDIGGRRMRLVHAGEGWPTVILEAGAGGFSAVWGPVQREVAKFTRVYSYDRAGYGKSEPAPHTEAHTSSNAVRDLHALLNAANVEPPYVLVGHSLGGFHVRLFTSMYPAESIGLVLVDADVEEEFTRVVPDEHRKGLDMITGMLRVAKSLARIGLPQIAVRLRAPQTVRGMPAEAKREVIRRGFTMHALHALHSEFENLGVSAAELRASKRDLGDRPLVVIRHGVPAPRLPGTSKERAADIETALEMMQRRMSMWSRRGRLLVAEKSGHDIHIDEPEVVINAIRDVVQILRAEAGRDSRGNPMRGNT